MTNVFKIINILYLFHKKFICQSFLLPRKLDRFGQFGVVFLLIFACLICFQTKMFQWNTWELSKDKFYFENKPMLSGNDSSLFLKQARNKIEKKSQTGKRDFPDSKSIQTENYQEPKIFQHSLIIDIIIWSSNFFFDGDIFNGANLLIPISTAITVLSIGLFFFSLGFSYEGVLAAMSAGLSQSFFVRTSIGRVDTDILNIAFLYAILTLIFLGVSSKNKVYSFLFIFLAALINFLFCWWYLHPGFIVIFAFMIFLGSILYNKNLVTNVTNLIIFLVFSGINFSQEAIASVFDFLKTYFFAGNLNINNNINNEKGIFYPDTYNTISEIQNIDFLNLLQLISGSNVPWLSILGFIGIVIFIIVNPRKSFFFLPIFIFFLLTIILGKRFLIYTVPLIWFGTGYFIISFTSLIYGFFYRFENIEKSLTLISLPLVIILMFFTWYNSLAYCQSIKNYTCIPKYIPKTITSPIISKGIKNISSYSNYKDTIIYTWWDYGNWINLITDLITLIDAHGNHRTPKGYFIAKSLTSKSQFTSHKIIQYVLSNNEKNIYKDSKDFITLKTKINNSEFSEKPVFIFLTYDFLRWWGSISYIGNWDIINNRKGKVEKFESIQCKYSGESTLVCGKFKINLKTGKINNGVQLEFLAYTKNGALIQEVKYKNFNANSPSLIISADQDKTRFFTLEKGMYENTFTQLFFLRKNNKNLFEIVEDNWPHYRTYKIKN